LSYGRKTTRSRTFASPCAADLAGIL